DAKSLRLFALLVNNRMRDLTRNRVIARSTGRVKIDGKDANSVEFTLNGIHSKFFFDIKSNLPVKQERETADGLVEFYYDDYRPIDGVKEPFSIKMKNRSGELRIAIDKIEHNGSLDRAAFNYPKRVEAAPLPDINSLM